MTDTNITCPKCGAEIPLSEAVSHRLREQLQSDFEQQRQQLNGALTAREKKLNDEQATLAQRQNNLAAELAGELEAERRKLTVDATRQAQEKVNIQLKDMQAQLGEQQLRLKEAQDAELTLRKKQRELEEAKDNLELEVARNQREARAELAVIVTTCPPDGLRGVGLWDGVWVCEPCFAAALAAALRHGLISTASQRLQEAGRADKMAALYDHLCGVAFRQHIEALVEAFLGLHEQLAAEQRAFARQWKEREQQLQKAITHTAMLYGGIQGIAGREALPEIKTLQLDGAVV